jgi:hypothetical protein
VSFALIVTLLVLVGLIVALAIEKWPAELVMLAALLVLTCFGVVKLDDRSIVRGWRWLAGDRGYRFS